LDDGTTVCGGSDVIGSRNVGSGVPEGLTQRGSARSGAIRKSRSIDENGSRDIDAAEDIKSVSGIRLANTNIGVRGDIETQVGPGDELREGLTGDFGLRDRESGAGAGVVDHEIGRLNQGVLDGDVLNNVAAHDREGSGNIDVRGVGQRVVAGGPLAADIRHTVGHQRSIEIEGAADRDIRAVGQRVVAGGPLAADVSLAVRPENAGEIHVAGYVESVSCVTSPNSE